MCLCVDPSLTNCSKENSGIESLCIYDDDDDTSVSVGLYLMKDPYDDELTWPLRSDVIKPDW